MSSGYIPRLRMFAGPNGSGKSTIKTLLTPELLGAYINPDEIQQSIESTGTCNLAVFGLATLHSDVRQFFQSSALVQRAGLQTAADEITVEEGTHIRFSPVENGMNAYLASVLADFVRRELLETKGTFTFETVLSSPDKVALLQQAKQTGYRTYLYFIATEDPEINVSRVLSRVQLGGHGVPTEKIISRYWRSLDLLVPAIRETNRAYIFDNSGSQLSWIAEITDGCNIELKSNRMPAWFQHHVWNKVDTQS